MENVSGLITRQTRSYFDSVLSKLRAAGYHLNWAVLHSADYGVPQKRRRLFVLGFRDKLLRFPIPTHGPNYSIPHVRSYDVIGLEPIGLSPNCPVKYARHPDLRSSPYAGHIYNGGGRPIDPNSPCHTILASSGGYKTHWIDTQGIAPMYHAHLLNGGKPWGGEVPGARRLSVEECARIQTFPAEIEFYGSRSSQYTQVGDAVPVILAQAVAAAVFSQLSASHAGDEYLDPDWEVSHYQTRLAI